MNRRRVSITSVCLGFLIAACSSGDNSESAKGGAGGNRSSSTPSGGNSGSSSGGGSSAKASSGSSVSSSGGSSASSNGGSSKEPTGGSSAGTGGAGGGKAGASGTAGAGGGTGGAGGKATGGTAGGAAGGSGTASTGGGQAGASGTAGSSGTGGKSEPSTPTSVVVTSADKAFWKTDTLTEGSGTANVTVSENAAQTWDGFGGAFNEMGWKYLNDSAMTDATREEALQLLYGKDGCNFAWGRIPIGSSDYAITRYSLDETANDTTMSKFSIDHDKDLKTGLIPYIQAAQKVKKDIRFWASPWSPPTWMKKEPRSPNTGKPSGSPFDGGIMKNDEATFSAFALYLVKFVQAYQEQGIKIETVAPQNEPNYEQNYPSCHWDTADYPKFIGSYLGPALEKAGLATKVMDGTLSNAAGGDADIGSAVLKDATAKKYCNAIGVQWGMADASRISTLKGLAGDIPIWISETQCGGNMNTSGPAPNDMNYGKNTWDQITGAIKAGVTAYNAWNMVLDKNGLGNDDQRSWPQNALLVADGGKIIQTPAYYVYRHFSQFVDVGAKVLGTSGGSAIAFKNPDGSYVVVMYNSGAANSKYTVSVGGKSLQFSMPGAGWATVKYSK